MEDLKKDLRRWVKEKWAAKDGSTDHKSGKKGWRPTVKVSPKTPETWGEMTPAEKKKKQANKKKANKKGGGWSTHLKGRKQVYNTKKSEYDMYTDFYQGSTYDNTTEFYKPSEYDMYSDVQDIQVGPLTIKVCKKDNQCKLEILDTNSGLKVAETEMSDHHESEHLQLIHENLEDLFHRYVEMLAMHDMAKFEDLKKAEYQGKKVTLGKPFRTPAGPKKYAVYVKNPQTGKTIKVTFGDPNMKIKRDSEKRRKSFRARHGCDNPGPRTKAKYWSCKFWSKKKVSDMV